jgi:cytochrome c oxidase assembly protein subunit 15
MRLVPGHLDAPDGASGASGGAPGAAAAPRSGGRGLARRLADTVLAPSPAWMRRIALAGVVATAGIIMTGEGVRLSQSGLGCPDWPRCTATSVIASGATGDPLIHRWVEFGNRLVTVAIFVIAIVVWVAAWRYRPDGRRRRDLLWLATAQPAGILVQAVLGGILVLTDLDPVWVSIHFLASMPLVAAAVALYVRSGEGRGPARPLVPREVRLGAFGAVGVLGLMIAAGTVVTGTGPLAGGRLPDGRPVPRFHLPLGGVTQFHADIGWLLGGLVIALVLGLRLTRAPRRAVRLGWTVLALIGVQGAIGYAQYFSGLPAGLVWVHVANAVLIWVVAILLLFALRDRGTVAESGQAATAEAGLQDAAAVSQADARPGGALSPDVSRR